MTSRAKNTKWTKADKFGGIALLLGLVLGSLWLSIPSSVFLTQDSMTIVQDEDEGWTMVSVRRLPFGSVEATWTAVYRVLGREDGLTCSQSGGLRYEPIPGDLVRYHIGSWAWPCLDSGPPISISYTRQVWIRGLIPLRSSVYSFTINPEAVPVVETGEG